DGEGEIEAGLVERPPVPQRGDKRVFGEAGDAALTDAGPEGAGRHHPERRMPQARERFGATEVFASEVDLGLVPDFEPALVEGLVDLDPRLLFGHGIDWEASLGALFDRP